MQMSPQWDVVKTYMMLIDSRVLIPYGMCSITVSSAEMCVFECACVCLCCVCVAAHAMWTYEDEDNFVELVLSFYFPCGF